MSRCQSIVMLALMLSTSLLSAPHVRPHLRPPRHPPAFRTHTPADIIRKVPWQLVVAGGAAVSGVVFAYKVGDGIQQGTAESARRAPEAFVDKANGVCGGIQLTLIVCLLSATVLLAWRFGRGCR